MIENVANGIKYKLDENANLYFEMESLAINAGITTVVDGKTYLRMKRINHIISNIFATSGKNFGVIYPLHKHDYIPETLAYVFLMRLDSKKASDFQIKLAEIASNIRKSGIKVGSKILDADYENENKDKKQTFNDAIKNYGKISGKIIGEANKDFVRNYDAKYHTRLNSRIKNYAKKNNKENVSVSDYIDENNLFPNAGKILNVAYYDNKLYLKINQRGEILSGLKYINYLFLIGGITMNIATTTIIRSNPYAAIGGIAVLTLISLYKAGKFDDLIEEVSKKGIEFKDNFIKYYKDKGIIIGGNEKGEPIFDKKKLNMYITNIERAYMFYRKLKF